MLVATSQPTFPLYVYGSVSSAVGPAFVTFLSTPFFFAVPAVARRFNRLGRAMLPLTGIANTLLCAKAFGVGSGVEVFLLPCIALSLLVFRRSEWRLSLPLAGAALAAGVFLHDRYGAPFHAYGPAELDAFTRLNFGSAATLTAVLSYRFAGLLEAERVPGRETGARPRT